MHLEALERRLLLTVPGVVAIARSAPVSASTAAGSVAYSVTFNQSVTGVDASDFRVTTSDSLVASSTVGVSGSGANYVVTVSGIHGSGDLRLDLVDNDSIVSAGVPLGGAGANNGSFQGQTYSVDQVAPHVVSINRSNPAGDTTSATSVSYAVTFSEAVTGVDAGDFHATASGGAAVLQPLLVSGSGSSYTVTVNGIAGSGQVRLDLVDNGTIRDLEGNALIAPSGATAFPGQTNFPAGNSPSDMAVADLNGDGVADVVTANFDDSTLSVLISNGDGAFQNQVAYATASSPSAVAAADVNGDGKIDLVALLSNDSIGVRLGNGDGTFQSEVDFPIADNATALAVADINGDQKPDVVVLDPDLHDIGVLYNNGAGGFQSEVSLASIAWSFSLTVADVNGDGKADLIVGQSNNTPSYFIGVRLGNGNGTFQNEMDFATGAAPLDIAVADLNGDHHVDLVASEFGADDVSVLLGNGNGTFQPRTSYVTGDGPTAVTVADVNNDGKPDLLVTDSLQFLNGDVADGGNEAALSFLAGNGDGTFQNQAIVPYAGMQPVGVAAADLNHDGQLDLVAANHGGDVAVLVNRGNGEFGDFGRSFDAGPDPVFMALADFNGDGSSDAAVVDGNTGGNNAVSILLSAGAGTFHTPTTAATLASPGSVTAADVNGDGKPDLLVANANNTVGVLLGNGNGTFQSELDYPTGVGPAVVAVGDLNGDGKPDLAISNLVDGTVSILLGNGAGVFVAQPAVTVGASPTFVSIADFTGDGKADLAVLDNTGTSIDVFKGNGDGTFQGPTSLSLPSVSYWLSVADVDRDGKADLVASGSGFANVFRGKGDGTFQSVQSTATGTFASGTTVTDLDGDGLPDLVVGDISTFSNAQDLGGNSESALRYLRGNGDGTFQSPALIPYVGAYPFFVAAIDDGGRPDLLVGNSNSNSLTVVPNSGRGGFLGQTYTVTTPPLVLSINRSAPSGQFTAGTSVTYAVAFSVPVTGVDAGDFSLSLAGGMTSSGLVVAGSGSAYTVTINGVTGTGNLQLNLVDDDSIQSAGLPLGGAGAGNGNFLGQVYTFVVAPTVRLNVATASFTTTWYNNGGQTLSGLANGAVALANMAQATLTETGTTLASMTVSLLTFHAGDVLTVPLVAGTSIAASYSAGTLTLTGPDTLAHFQQELRLLSYNNTAGGPGVTQTKAVVTVNDGTVASTAATATINIVVPTAGAQVLGNRLFYNNSKYDGHGTGGTSAGDAAVNSFDDAAVASDKIGFSGAGTATFANVSSFTKGITGIIVDLKSGLGNHAAITRADITFKVAPTTFVAGTYNQISTWSSTLAPTPSVISVRLGAGVGGSDRIEIVWPASIAVKNNWLAIDVKSTANTGLSQDDVFYFGNVVGDSGLGDPTGQAKTESTDASQVTSNLLGATTQVFQILDYDKNGAVDAGDRTTASGNTALLRYLANTTASFAPDGAAPSGSPAVAAAVLPTAVLPAAVLPTVMLPTVTASGSADRSSLAALTSGLGFSAGQSPGNRARPAAASADDQPPRPSSRPLHALETRLLEAVDRIFGDAHSADDALERLFEALGLE